MAVETYQYDQISIHALREEGDPTAWWPLLTGTYFYPRPPRGGRRPCGSPAACCCPISIHALLAEGDVDLRRPQVHPEAISIHALREEGDRCTDG